MKSSIHYILCLFGILAVSCSEPDNSALTPAEADNVVFLRLKTQTSTTRTIEQSQQGLPARLYTAIIYFLDDQPDPLIHKVITVAPAGATLTPDELAAGVAVEGIPADATQIYMVGNWNSSDAYGNYADFPLLPYHNFSSVASTLLNIEQVNYWEFGDGTPAEDGTLVTIMDGYADLQVYSSATGWNGGPGPTDGDFFAEVALVPLVARVEFNGISVMLNTREITYQGVYVDDFYTTLPLSLDDEGSDRLYNGANPVPYDALSPTFAYTDYRSMYQPVGYTSSTATYLPTSYNANDGDNFSFQVFGGSPVPRLIFRFTDVLVETDLSYSERFGTVRGFRNTDGSELTTLERNTIYYVEEVSFSDLTPVPNTDDIWLHVRVAPWTEAEVFPYN